MAEEIKKHCGTCKYDYLGPGYEPCKSCSDSCDGWVSKEATDEEKQEKTCNNCKHDHLYSFQLPCAHCMNDEYWEAKEPEKHTYYVAYLSSNRALHTNGAAYVVVELDKKISSVEDINKLMKLIKCTDKDAEQIIIINWKELEG